MRLSVVLFCLTLSAIACGCRPYAQPQPVIYCPTRCVTPCPQQSPCTPAPVRAGETLQPVPDRATSGAAATGPSSYAPPGSLPNAFAPGHLGTPGGAGR